MFLFQIADVVSESLDEHFPSESGVRVIAEPGRFFVASAFTLCANIIAKRDTMSEEGRPPILFFILHAYTIKCDRLFGLGKGLSILS